MGKIKLVISLLQTILITLYIIFYNVQYFWSVKSLIVNIYTLIAGLN